MSSFPLSYTFLSLSTLLTLSYPLTPIKLSKYTPQTSVQLNIHTYNAGWEGWGEQEPGGVWTGGWVAWLGGGGSGAHLGEAGWEKGQARHHLCLCLPVWPAGKNTWHGFLLAMAHPSLIPPSHHPCLLSSHVQSCLHHLSSHLISMYINIYNSNIYIS